MPVNKCRVTIGIDAASTILDGPSTPTDPFAESSITVYGPGYGPGNVLNEFGDARAMIAAGYEEFPLAGNLQNKITELEVLDVVRVFYVRNTSTVANLAIGGGSNPAPMFCETLGPGERAIYDAGPTGPGKKVVPGMTDTIRITSDAPGATYSIYLAGCPIPSPGSVLATCTASSSAAASQLIPGSATGIIVTTPSVAIVGAIATGSATGTVNAAGTAAATSTATTTATPSQTIPGIATGSARTTTVSAAATYTASP